HVEALADRDRALLHPLAGRRLRGRRRRGLGLDLAGHAIELLAHARERGLVVALRAAQRPPRLLQLGARLAERREHRLRLRGDLSLVAAPRRLERLLRADAGLLGEEALLRRRPLLALELLVALLEPPDERVEGAAVLRQHALGRLHHPRRHAEAARHRQRARGAGDVEAHLEGRLHALDVEADRRVAQAWIFDRHRLEALVVRRDGDGGAALAERVDDRA